MTMKMQMRVNTLLPVMFVLMFWAAAASASARAHAQEPAQGTSTARADQARERLQEIQQRLALTPEQLEQVRPVFTEELQQLKAVRDKYADDQNRRSRRKMAREMRDVQKAADEKLKKILTSKQMDELKTIREEWRKQMRERADAR
jgi:TolA-binding protein